MSILKIDKALPNSEKTIISFDLKEIKEIQKELQEAVCLLLETANKPCDGECREGDTCSRCEEYNRGLGKFEYNVRQLYRD